MQDITSHARATPSRTVRPTTADRMTHLLANCQTAAAGLYLLCSSAILNSHACSTDCRRCNTGPYSCMPNDDRIDTTLLPPSHYGCQEDGYCPNKQARLRAQSPAMVMEAISWSTCP